MNYKVYTVIAGLIIFTVFIAGCGAPSKTTTNPSSTISPYAQTTLSCRDRGGTIEIKVKSDGSEYKMCKLPNGLLCEESALSRGEGCKDAIGVKSTIDHIDAIKTNAKNVSYDDLFRYNENYIGKTVYYRGKIIQIILDDGNNYEFRVATKKSEYSGYSDDVLFVNCQGPRFLEGDIIDLWGQVEGLETYSAVLGHQVTIPKVTALHTELVEKRP